MNIVVIAILTIVAYIVFTKMLIKKAQNDARKKLEDEISAEIKKEKEHDVNLVNKEKKAHEEKKKELSGIDNISDFNDSAGGLRIKRHNRPGRPQ